jgi:hypothetical protein
VTRIVASERRIIVGWARDRQKIIGWNKRTRTISALCRMDMVTWIFIMNMNQIFWDLLLIINVICFIGNWLLHKYVTRLIDIYNIYIYNICLFKQVISRKDWINIKYMRIIYKYKKNYLFTRYIQKIRIIIIIKHIIRICIKFFKYYNINWSH